MEKASDFTRKAEKEKKRPQAAAEELTEWQKEWQNMTGAEWRGLNDSEKQRLVLQDRERGGQVAEWVKQKKEEARIDALLPKGPVGELYRPMRSLVKNLAVQLESGDFEILVGEDASGRVPSFIMKRIIDRIYEMSGRPHPKMIFLAGGSISRKSEDREKKKNAIVAYLKESGLEQQNIHRALIITDTIHTGRSSSLLENALSELNIRVDIASVASTKSKSELGADYEYSHMHIGKDFFEPKVLHDSSISGVFKNDLDVHAKSTRTERRHFTTKDVHNQSAVNQARKDAKIVSDMICDWYMGIRPEILQKLEWKRRSDAAKARENKESI